jgi:hypothetical protein
MKKSQKIDYVKFIHCETAEEVYAQVRTWISGLSEHEHTVRSVILDIHARVEAGMKEILFLHLSELVVCYKDKEENYTTNKNKLEKTIQKMAFSHVHRLLKPCFDAFESTSLSQDLPAIDELRNEVAHRSGNSAKYKGRSPFTDHDCFAQLYVDSWSINQELGDFIEKMIDNPKEFKRRGWLHFLGKPIT